MPIQLNPERDWARLGDSDPYYGVISQSKFRSTNIDKNAKDEFFAGGRIHVDQVLAVLRDALEFEPHGTALDFGCGVGRIANALSPHFESVVGLDISPGMLMRAKEDAREAGILNVTYKSSRDESLLSDSIYDFVHTYIVLQHIPTKIGERVIRRLLMAIKPGGVGAIHFTFSETTPSINSTLKKIAKNTPIIRNAANIIVGRKWNSPVMQMNNYSLSRVFKIFMECGVVNFKLHLIDDWGNFGAFVFFKKPEGDVYFGWSNPVR
jgi:2-polyprenyl-3-methyl-5-hydroxy-6-metoxy-1,4-benzoquinol methylase